MSALARPRYVARMLAASAVFTLAVLPLAFSADYLPPVYAPGAVNPAVTQANIQTTICRLGWTKTVRPDESYTEALKRKLIWLMADRRPWDYELDHRVPLEVGGAPKNPRNLWPEPRSGMYNAAAKDRLENRIHWLVCHGRMTLQAGQQVFLGNWIDGYLRYVGFR